jgi:hypothetical protein
MRILVIVALSATLVGCGAPRPEMAQASTSRLGDQFVGQNVTALVAQFGKPVSRKKIDNDQITYVWDLEAPTEPPDNRRTIDTGGGGLYEDGHTPGYFSDDLRLCKMSVTVSREGIVTQVSTEETNGTDAPSSRTFGFNGSVCAQRLGAKPRT